MSPCANELISKRPDFGLFIRCHEIYFYFLLLVCCWNWEIYYLLLLIGNRILPAESQAF
jgi:hypothetical protein